MPPVHHLLLLPVKVSEIALLSLQDETFLIPEE